MGVALPLPAVRGATRRVLTTSVALVVVVGGVGCSAAGGAGGTGSSKPSRTAPASPAGTTSAGTSSPLATESNPPGDIPDNQVFVRYGLPGAAFTVTVPEGWARKRDGRGVRFEKAVNSVRVEQLGAAAAPSATAARRSAPAMLGPRYRNLRTRSVTHVSRRAGGGLLVRLTADSPPDPVTGRVVVDDVQLYEFWHRGHLAVVTLAGPLHADNVDPWRTVTDSLRWR